MNLNKDYNITEQDDKILEQDYNQLEQRLQYNRTGL